MTARPVILGSALAAVIALQGCTGSSPRFTPSPPVRIETGGRYSAFEEGMASYYGDEFNGRKTSNGEIFDMTKLTAAHKSLPFHSVVKVTNLDNNLSVVVRVNDRGPFVKGRIIDLSQAAAEAIRMIGTGTARVSVEVIEFGPEPAKTGK